MYRFLLHKPFLSKALILAGMFLWSNVTYAGSARLTWDANSEPDLAGYTIYYATASHSGTCPAGYTNSVDAGNVTSYWFDALTPGQTYYFQITAKDDSDNESGCSVTPGEVSKVVTYRGDLNVDHAVNVLDYGILHTNFGNTTPGNAADINRDNIVNVLDYSTLHGDFGSSF